MKNDMSLKHRRLGSLPTSLLALLAIGFAGCGNSQRTEPRNTIDAPAKPPAQAIDVQHLNRELTAFVQSHGRNWGETHAFSGYVHLVQGEQVVYSKGFGFRDREAKALNTADTSFRIGSVTKQFTAAAILKLEQEGKLSVDDTVKKHIADYPEVGANLTIHQLLSHTAGVPSYTEIKEVMEHRDEKLTPLQLLQTFWDKPLEFEPGSQWKYSNSGYVVLGAIVERASDMSYGEYMRTAIFEPTGLTDTTIGDAETVVDRALGYEVKDESVVKAMNISMSIPYAAGAARSTARDLVRWHRALLGETLLSEASKAKLYTPVKNTYAYGWQVEERDGHQTISHGGGIDGFLTSYTRVMDADLAVVVWSNNSNVPPEPIARAAVVAAFGGNLEPAPEKKSGVFDPALAAACAGDYKVTPESRAWLADKVPAEVIEQIETMHVEAGTNVLKVTPAKQPQFELAAAEGGAFFNTKLKVGVRCVLKKGQPQVTTIEVQQGGTTLVFSRAE